MNFLVFSDDWGVHPSSCQHIFRILSKEHPTVWVNTIGMRRPRLSLGDAKKALLKVSRMLSGDPPRARASGNDARSGAAVTEFSGSGAPGGLVATATATTGCGVTVCAPPMLPFRRPRAVARWNDRSVEHTVRRALADRDLDDVCLVTTVPNIHGAVQKLGATSVVYYCVDDFSEWPGMNRDAILDMESRLLPTVDKAVCTSRALYDRFESQVPTWLLTHGVDVERFAACSLPGNVHPCLASIPEPRVGYFGLLDERTDSDLVKQVARTMPHISFVFTGPVEGRLRSLQALPNIHLTGSVPYDDLPSIVRGWRACLLPYRINALTEKINPLKLKEYLASGKPVLSTPLPEAVRLSDHLGISASAGEWCDEIESMVRGDRNVSTAGTRDYLAGESWQNKAEELLRICEST